MIQLSNCKLPPGYREEDIRRILNREGIPPEAWWTFRKLSLDARKKDQLHYLCTLLAGWENEPGKKSHAAEASDAPASSGRGPASSHRITEAEYLRRRRSPDISVYQENPYRFPLPGEMPLPCRPVVVGAGPAGLFAARLLTEAGYRPILIERGAPVEERTEDVSRFWREGRLKPDSNVQFGEGGAGTFSDGKLMTQTKDREGRIRQVLTWFVEAGADPSILYWNKPHIGTDVLKTVVRNMRQSILEGGGEILFHTKMEEILTDQENRVRGIRLVRTDRGKEGSSEADPLKGAASVSSGGEILETNCLILCPGHSARDTFSMLDRLGVPLEAKSFAVGLRIEHPQRDIDLAQYGRDAAPDLPTADYKLTGNTKDGRGIYSFCMCPGGQVVNASSEEGGLVVNGMSRAARDGRNANSALVISVTPADYPCEGPLAGIRFQRQLERLAWEAGEGRIPVQLLGDFCRNQPTSGLGDVLPDLCGAWQFADLRQVLPAALGEGLASAIPGFGRKIHGYDRPDAVLSGVESRTSSPVRILRDEHFESPVKGLFPCGEGAGYAGGITSAAVDGLKTAEEIIRRYRPVG